MKRTLAIATSTLALLILGLVWVLSAQAHHTDLTWSAGVGGGQTTGYNIKRSLTSGGPYLTIGTTTGATTYSDSSGLVEGTKYYYVVTATGPGGESAQASNEASGTVPFSVPPTPTGLTVIPR